MVTTPPPLPPMSLEDAFEYAFAHGKEMHGTVEGACFYLAEGNDMVITLYHKEKVVSYVWYPVAYLDEVPTHDKLHAASEKYTIEKINS